MGSIIREILLCTVFETMFEDKELLRFYKYCGSLTGDTTWAYDLLLTSMEKFTARKALGLELSPSLEKKYFLMILRKRYFSEYRERMEKKDSTLPANSAMSTVIPVYEPIANEIYLDPAQVGPIMKEMTDEERELLFFWAREGLKLQDISELIGVSKGALLARLQRVQKKLHKVIWRENIAR